MAAAAGFDGIGVPIVAWIALQVRDAKSGGTSQNGAPVAVHPDGCPTCLLSHLSYRLAAGVGVPNRVITDGCPVSLYRWVSCMAVSSVAGEPGTSVWVSQAVLLVVRSRGCRIFGTRYGRLTRRVSQNVRNVRVGVPDRAVPGPLKLSDRPPNLVARPVRRIIFPQQTSNRTDQSGQE